MRYLVKAAGYRGICDKCSTEVILGRHEGIGYWLENGNRRVLIVELFPDYHYKCAGCNADVRMLKVFGTNHQMFMRDAVTGLN